MVNSLNTNYFPKKMESFWNLGKPAHLLSFHLSIIASLINPYRSQLHLKARILTDQTYSSLSLSLQSISFCSLSSLSFSTLSYNSSSPLLYHSSSPLSYISFSPLCHSYLFLYVCFNSLFLYLCFSSLFLSFSNSLSLHFISLSLTPFLSTLSLFL